MTWIRKLLRNERGSLMTTMAFIIVGTGVTLAAVSWFLLRQAQDYANALDAKAKSSLQELSSNVLGQLNKSYPSTWAQMSAADLASATAGLGDTPALQATSHLERFTVNSTTGNIVADAVATSTQNKNIKVYATIKFVPSGAAVFTGVDANGRPNWLYSSDNIDALALWGLAPNGVAYIDPNGGNIADQLSTAPTVALTATSTGATSVVESVYCQYGGTAEYQWQTRESNGPWSAWSGWSTNQKADWPLVEGQRVELQAQARCVSALSESAASPTSTPVSYVRPITQVFTGPAVTVNTDGTVTWSPVSCSNASAQQYTYQSRVNGGLWTPWSSWGAAKTFTMTSGEGQMLEAQVQARCANEYVTGPPSSVGYGSAISAITTVPNPPVVASAAPEAYTVSVTGTCPTGTTAQWANRTLVNGGDWSGYGAWTDTSATVQIRENEGDRISVQAIARCNGQYNAGPASDAGPVFVKNIPVTSLPTSPTPYLAADGSSFSWSAATCPTGTTAHYIPSYEANGASTWTAAEETTGRGPVSVTVNQGGTLKVHFDTFCQGYSATPGPTGTSNDTTFTRTVTSAPATPTVTVNSDSSFHWVASGCPAGTTVQSQVQIATNGNSWGAWTGWGSGNTYGVVVTYGDQFDTIVHTRCANPLTGIAGPNSTYTLPAYWVRGMPTPGGAWGTVSSGTVAWANNCAAGYPVFSEYGYYTAAPSYNWTYGWSTATSRPRPLAPIYSGYQNWYVNTYCQGNYAASGQTGNVYIGQWG